MKKKLFQVLSLVVLLSVFSLINAQVVLWEEDFDPHPTGWDLEGNWSFGAGFLRLNWSPGTENFDMSAVSPEIDLPAEVGDLVVTQLYSDWSAVDEVLQIIVIHGTEETVLWTYNCTQGSFPEDVFEFSLVPFAGETIQLKFRGFGADTWNINNWDIFNIAIMGSIDNDLAAISISGHTTPSVNQEVSYTVVVRNNGVITQDDYTVRLMQQGDIELYSVDGDEIEHGEEISYVFDHTFTEEGATYLWGEVIFDDDEMPGNNVTQNLNITVMPEDISYVQIGDGDLTGNYLPLNVYWRNNFSQSVYTADDFNYQYGTITAIEYFNSFVDNLPGRDIKIWMAQTTQGDIANDWLPSTEFLLVYDGTIDFPVGDNTVMIPLQVPFSYSYGNLVVMANRCWEDDWHSSSNVWYHTDTGTAGRSRYVHSDSVEYDPDTLPAGTVTSRIPNTGFFFTDGDGLENDMAALTLTGNTTPSVNSPTVYTVRVKNIGVNDQDDYTVRLMTTDGVELVSEDVDVLLEQFEELDVELTWTPTQTGPVSIYGEVILDGDEIEANNTTNILNINVQEEGLVAVTVGTATTVANTLPVNFFWRNSISQVIYMSDELNIGGLLTGITYYSNFSSNLLDYPINIWVAETQETDLAADWLSYDQFTQVFQGTVDFPSGQNEIFIDFDEYFAYGGDNLVIMANRPMDTEWHSSMDHFYYTQTPAYPNRARFMHSDSVEYDPANLTGGTLDARVPNTTLYFSVDGMGSLEGYVYDEDESPMQGVHIAVDGTNFTQTSNADGYFYFAYVPEGTFDVIASKHGYYDSTVEDVVIIEDELTDITIDMVMLPNVTVSGTVVGSDYPDVGLVDALILLTGYENYEANTDASGDFEIPGVFADQTYNITVTYSGYTTHHGEVVVGDSDLDIGTIILDEIAFPPSNVVATFNPAEDVVDVVWQVPGTALPTEFRYDDGVQDEQLGFGGGTPQHVLGAAHRHDAQIYEVTWVTTSEGGPHNSVHLYIFGLNAAGQPDSDQLLYHNPNVPNQDNEWNTYELAEPVDAPNGFLVGLGFAGFLGLATDDGIGDPWAFVPGTQYGVAGYTSAPWTPIENWGFEVNYMLRAYGLDFGEIDYRGADTVARTPVSASGERLTTGNSSRTFEIGKPVYQRAQELTYQRSRLDLRGGVNRSQERLLEEYTIFRLAEGQENNESLWIELGTVTDTTFVDEDFVDLDAGVYKYAVKAVYTNNVLSDPAFSNTVEHDMYCQVTINVTTNSGDNVAGAIVQLVNENQPETYNYTMTAPASGIVVFPEVWKGIYTVEVALEGFETYHAENVDFTGEVAVYNVQLIELLLPVVNLDWTVEGNNVTLAWEEPGTPLGEPWFEGFEDAFPPAGWASLSPDGGTGWEQLASGTTPLPGWTGGEALPAPDGGNFMAFCTWETGGASSNDQWLITPELIAVEGFEISFYLRYWPDSYPDYVEILISTGEQTNTNDFTIVVDELHFTSGSSTDWILYTYDLGDFVSPGTSFYIAFRETVADNFNEGAAIMLDNVYVGPPLRYEDPKTVAHTSYGERSEFSNRVARGNANDLQIAINESDSPMQRVLTGYNIYQDGEVLYENHQDLSFVVSDLPGGIYVFGVSAVYTTGESEIVETDPIEISSTEELVVIKHSTALRDNYPNPFNPSTTVRFSLAEDKEVSLEVYNIRGQRIRTLVNDIMESGMHEIVWDGKNSDGRESSSGIYFIRMRAGDYNKSQKIIMMK